MSSEASSEAQSVLSRGRTLFCTPSCRCWRSSWPPLPRDTPWAAPWRAPACASYMSWPWCLLRTGRPRVRPHPCSIPSLHQLVNRLIVGAKDISWVAKEGPLDLLFYDPTPAYFSWLTAMGAAGFLGNSLDQIQARERDGVRVICSVLRGPIQRDQYLQGERNVSASCRARPQLQQPRTEPSNSGVGRSWRQPDQEPADARSLRRPTRRRRHAAEILCAMAC